MRRILLLLLLAGLPLSGRAAKSFCCDDANGHQACSDILPPECYGRAYREISENGIVLQRVEAPLSAQQKAVRQTEAKKKKEEERAATDERRRNQALLNTYSSVQDIDFVRERALTDLDRARKRALDRLNEALQRKRQLDNEAEFYKKKPMPYELQTQIKSNDIELQAQQAAIDAKQQEMTAVRARFDEEKQRYSELTRGRNGAP